MYRFFQDQSYFCFWKICLGSFDVFSSFYQISGVSVIMPSWINVTAAVVLTRLRYMHNPRCSSAHVHVLYSHAQKVWCFRETFALREWHSCWVLEQLVRDSLKASDFLTIHYAMCIYTFLPRKPGIKIYRESNFSQILIFHILQLLQTVFANHKTTGICTQLWEKTSVPSFHLFVTALKKCSVFSSKAMWQKGWEILVYVSCHVKFWVNQQGDFGGSLERQFMKFFFYIQFHTQYSCDWEWNNGYDLWQMNQCFLSTKHQKIFPLSEVKIHGWAGKEICIFKDPVMTCGTLESRRNF